MSRATRGIQVCDFHFSEEGEVSWCNVYLVNAECNTNITSFDQGSNVFNIPLGSDT